MDCHTGKWYKVKHGVEHWSRAFKLVVYLTIVLLNTNTCCLEKTVDPDQLASHQANWSRSKKLSINPHQSQFFQSYLDVSWGLTGTKRSRGSYDSTTDEAQTSNPSISLSHCTPYCLLLVWVACFRHINNLTCTCSIPGLTICQLKGVCFLFVGYSKEINETFFLSTHNRCLKWCLRK